MALVHPGSVSFPQASSPPDTLPPNFPPSLSSSLVWTGADLSDENTYIYHLTPSDLAEIDAALQIFKSPSPPSPSSPADVLTIPAHELDGDLANTQNFPLPTLQHTLDRLSHDLHDGKGLFLIRGLTPDRYSVEDSMVIFMGLQAYIAEQKAKQDSQGNMIGTFPPFPLPPSRTKADEGSPYHLRRRCRQTC